MGEYQKVAGIITLCVVALLPGKLSAQDDGIQSETLRVGVVALEPFAMKTVDGHWEGISIDLWREVADRMGQGPIVKYLAKTEFLGRVEVLPGTFDHHYMGMAVPPGSPLREPLNRALLEFMETDEWTQILKQYLGQGS